MYVRYALKGLLLEYGHYMLGIFPIIGAYCLPSDYSASMGA